MPDLEGGTGAVLTTGSGCVVGQGTVDDKGLCAVDLGDGDEGLVQTSVASIANKVVQILLIIILVAAAGAVFLAQAGDWECGVGAVRVCRVRVALVDESISAKY